jgi:uncharacterized SAM-dependent methyltransferase
MTTTASDLIEELDYCATAIEKRAPEICRRPADWHSYMVSYLDIQVASARRLDCRPIVEAFEAARYAFSTYVGIAIAVDILRGAAQRLHRQYINEKVLP